MATPIGNKTTKGLPRQVTAAVARGVPLHKAIAMGPKPSSSVRVG